MPDKSQAPKMFCSIFLMERPYKTLKFAKIYLIFLHNSSIIDVSQGSKDVSENEKSSLPNDIINVN